jgi:hypothetical protein
MSQLDSIKDNYGQDSGTSIVAYFLSNASSWKGETAKRIKLELNKMLKSKNQVNTSGGVAKPGLGPEKLYKPGSIFEETEYINPNEFDDDEKSVIFAAINRFSSAGPPADKNTFKYFSKELVLGCLRKFINSKNLQSFAKKIAEKAVQKLSANELSETSATGGVGGYSTPFAFSGGLSGNEKKRKQSATAGTGYKIVGDPK